MKLTRTTSVFVIALMLTSHISCTDSGTFRADFNNVNDRIWIGNDFWSIPLEDWKIEDGRIIGKGIVPDSRVNILTRIISPGAGTFELKARFGLLEKRDKGGSAGFRVGIIDGEDPDLRSACYFGKGINAGVDIGGFAFLGDKKFDLPGDFGFDDFQVQVNGSNNKLKMKVLDDRNSQLAELEYNMEGLHGLVAIVINKAVEEGGKTGNSSFWADDLELRGSKITESEDNSFGPVLWTMYTLSKKTLKIMALLPPIGVADNQNVSLQISRNGKWEKVADEMLEPDSRTVVFKLTGWPSEMSADYRIEYIERDKNGNETTFYYPGTIQRDPVDRPLRFGGLTCQFFYGFPYTPLVNNLRKLNPDILYFSGDQIYEGNGGYPIKRNPADVSILSYLGKYYMFGWAFGDLMRNCPTICTPDDHDVFHGNLWGEEGEDKPEGMDPSDSRGFMQSVKMVNAVNRTQCGQLPDPWDPTPVKRGMSVWYTGLTYGRVSFAIISDRIYKSGPERVAVWEGRNDHLKEPLKDMSILDKPELQFLGERQMNFLSHWIEDWEGADMKALLSQTVFTNAATHHGQISGYLYGDLDSGGWPKSGRDAAIRLMRKGSVFQICGDQHIPSLIQYGLDDFRDAGWCFCTPAISNMYLRWFLPDELGRDTLDRPEHGFPDTGKYTDAFGNKNYVYAIGNPGENVVDRDSRYSHAQLRSSGFGFVTFDQKERSIKIDSWRFIADVENPDPVRDEFPGWPLTISQYDNYGLGAKVRLPAIKVNESDQLIRVYNAESGELLYVTRIKGNTIQPLIRIKGKFNILIGEGSRTKELTGILPLSGQAEKLIEVNL